MKVSFVREYARGFEDAGELVLKTVVEAKDLGDGEACEGKNKKISIDRRDHTVHRSEGNGFDT